MLPRFVRAAPRRALTICGDGSQTSTLEVDQVADDARIISQARARDAGEWCRSVTAIRWPGGWRWSMPWLPQPSHRKDNSTIRSAFPHYPGLVATVGNGVDVSHFSAGATGRIYRRAKPNERVILFVGRVSPERGFHTLFDSIQLSRSPLLGRGAPDRGPLAAYQCRRPVGHFFAPFL